MRSTLSRVDTPLLKASTPRLGPSNDDNDDDDDDDEEDDDGEDEKEDVEKNEGLGSPMSLCSWVQ